MIQRWGLLLYMGLVQALPLFANSEDPWLDPGPPSSRDLFPLNLTPLSYRPIGAKTVGQGHWRFSFQVTRSNTFEFSDLIKERLGRDNTGRISIDQAGAAKFASSLPNEPLVFFFDAEIQRTEFSFRYGVTPNTDLALNLGWQSIGGGFLDGPIEDFHKLGFEQTGRDAIMRNQLTMVIIQKGQVTYFTQSPVRFRPVDPVLAIIHRLYEDPNLTLSVHAVLQIPTTMIQGEFRSNWDSSAGLTFQWRQTHDQVFNGGAAYLRRSLIGGHGVNPFLIKDQIAGHIGWEWQGWTRARPFLVLVYHDGLTSQGPGATLDKPSVINDLGVHIRISTHSTLTFSYINNITHHENTSDMGLALRLTMRL